MTRRIVISGSIAYDTIMVFDGYFKDHILPDRTHMLNVAFLAPRLKREFGGTAANIAYNLRLLEGEAVLLATIGHDGVSYLERLQSLGVDIAGVQLIDEHYTAQAFITTDLADNQITAFHPGAMSVAHSTEVRSAMPAAIGIVAPNGKQAMLAHAAQFREHGIPYVFDPGQGLPMFDGDELRALVREACAVAVNDYECGMLCQRTGWREADVARQVDALIVTHGGAGSTVHTGGNAVDIAAVPIAQPVDPTGCGDAYRAGLLYGVAGGRGWVDAARLGSVLGAIKIEHQGAQNHVPTRTDIADRFRAAFGAFDW